MRSKLEIMKERRKAQGRSDQHIRCMKQLLLGSFASLSPKQGESVQNNPANLGLGYGSLNVVRPEHEAGQRMYQLDSGMWRQWGNDKPRTDAKADGHALPVVEEHNALRGDCQATGAIGIRHASDVADRLRELADQLDRLFYGKVR